MCTGICKTVHSLDNQDKIKNVNAKFCCYLVHVTEEVRQRVIFQHKINQKQFWVLQNYVMTAWKPLWFNYLEKKKEKCTKHTLQEKFFSIIIVQKIFCYSKYLAGNWLHAQKSMLVLSKVSVIFTGFKPTGIHQHNIVELLNVKFHENCSLVFNLFL